MNSDFILKQGVTIGIKFETKKGLLLAYLNNQLNAYIYGLEINENEMIYPALYVGSMCINTYTVNFVFDIADMPQTPNNLKFK